MRPAAARLGRVGTGLAGLALTAGLLSGCSSSAGAGAQACSHVNRAARYMKDAGSTGGSSAVQLRHRAEHELDLAEPLAADIAGTNGAWQALQANLQQLNGPPDRVLMQALVADCAALGD